MHDGQRALCQAALGWQGVAVTHCGPSEGRGWDLVTASMPRLSHPEMDALVFPVFCFSTKLLQNIYSSDPYFCGSSPSSEQSLA